MVSRIGEEFCALGGSDWCQQAVLPIEPSSWIEGGEVFESLSVAGDGRPILEVTVISATDDAVRLSGTACAFEGNVLIEVLDDKSRWIRHHTQATNGGPNRGEWTIELPVQRFPMRFRVGDEDAREGGISRGSLVEFDVDGASLAGLDNQI